MNIGIANDHRGVQAKQFLTEYLTQLGYNVIDYGADSEEPADFPDYAKKLGLGVLANEVEDLQAMLVICVNSLMEAIEKDKEAIMKPITGGAKVPGAF